MAQQIGCAVSMVRKIELDERRPSKQLAALLADGLNLPESERVAFLKAARAEGTVDRLGSASITTAPPAIQIEQPAQTRATQLPAPTTTLIGRTHDLSQLHAIAAQPNVRLVTLTGPGGTGKTRLALQFATERANSYADGVVFVDLAPLTDADQVVATIAQVLGVRELVGTTLVERLREYLQPRHMLLLDNFEHLLGAAPIVADLLRAAPTLTVVVTSRVVLRLSGEHEYPVPPLDVPPLIGSTSQHPNPPMASTTIAHYPAVQLFVERARAVQPAFGLTEGNGVAVAEICRRLDGLPLAIELAAARVKLFSAEALLARLNDRLRLLTGGARDLPTRQQALRATIDWSYQLLAPAEQRLFWRLAVFVGGWTLEAAEAICNSTGDLGIEVIDGLQTLVDHSLVHQEIGSDGSPRFRRLETIGEYASELLVSSGEEQTLRRCHAVYFTEFAEHAYTHSYGSESKVWYERLANEYDNLHAALSWSVAANGDASIALRLAAALYLFWINRGPLNEGFRWIKRALALPWDEEVREARAAALNAAGRQAVDVAELDVAEQFLTESLELYEQLEDLRSCSEVLNHLGIVHHWRRNMERAVVYQEASLRAAEAVGSRDRAAWALGCLSWIRALEGYLEQALELHHAAQTIFDAIPDQMGRALSLTLKGYIQWQAGDAVGANISIIESQRFSQAEVGSRPETDLLLLLAEIAREQGNHGEAEALLKQCLTLAQEYGLLRDVALVNYALCHLALTRGDGSTAQTYLHESLTGLHVLGCIWSDMELLVSGAVAIGTEQFVMARKHYGAYFVNSQEDQVAPAQHKAALALAITGLATALALESPEHYMVATRLWGASAEVYNSRVAIPFGPSAFRTPRLDPALLKCVQDSTHGTLGEAAFDAAWAAGQALTLDQAVAEALAFTAL